MRKLVYWAALALAITGRVLADDWPQWGGPNRDHLSKEKGLLQDWPAGGPKQVWANENAGMGYSGVAIAEGKLYTMGARGDKEFLLAMEANTGKELWAAEIGSLLKNQWGDGPRSTPTVDRGQVFALGGQGTLIAVNIADGKVQWRKRMQELGGKIPNWGYCESVLVEDAKVYCTPGGSKGALAALDQKTGDVVWQSKDFTEGAQYSSIVPATINGTRHLVQLTMQKFAGINARDGSLLWSSDFPGRTAVIPTPVVRDNFVYVTAGYGVGCELVKITPENKATVVYEDNKVMKNHHGGVVLIGEHIYGYSDGPGWVCQNFQTGTEVWASKKLGKGAVVAAGDRLYCLDEESGTIALVEASPKGWNEHGRFKLEPQSKNRSPSGRIWMHPVVANGKLYLRDQEYLLCYDVAAK
jgi:outer membrane protein assembly factor BamB